MKRRVQWDAFWRLAGVVAFAGMATIAVDAHAQSAERGRQLYENHCQVCHTAKIHGRKNRTTLTIDDLREIVRRWQENQGLRWTREEVDDVTHYLATTKYDFSASVEPRDRARSASGSGRPRGG